MTDQEKANKKEARRLIKLPLNKRPDNVQYIKATRLDHDRYIVFFGDIAVCFLQTEKQLVYLGEYPASNFRNVK